MTCSDGEARLWALLHRDWPLPEPAGAEDAKVVLQMSWNHMQRREPS